MKKSNPLLKITAIIVTLIFFTIGVFSETVNTKQGIFTLPSVDKLVDATAVRSAKRVAELAIPALISDAKEIAQKREALQPEIDNYTNDLDKYNTDLKLYNISLDSYNQNVNTYETELSSYDSQLYPHNAAVESYNSLSEDNRSQSDYDRLMASKNVLDTWLNSLNNKKANLDIQMSRVNNHKADLDYDYADLNARYEHIKYQLNSINIELGKAYDQLEMLIIYSEKCNKILEEWSEPVLNTYNLNTQLEKLKALSNRGWN